MITKIGKIYKDIHLGKRRSESQNYVIFLKSHYEMIRSE
jgi:hypothetical protein